MLIGFTGKAQSGKSTACMMVQSRLPYVRRINFKDGLIEEMKEKFKDTLQEMLFMYPEECTNIDQLFHLKPQPMRQLMQNFGTDIRRAEDPEYWIKKWERAVLGSEGNIVTDDVRFLNEAEAIRRAGGIVIRIEREDLNSVMTHASETEMDLIVPDYTVKAFTGGHKELEHQIFAIVGQYDF